MNTTQTELQFKTCTKCNKTKPLSSYSRTKRKCGFVSRCKQCANEYYKENKNKIKKTQKKYYDQNRNKILEYQQQYTKYNKNKVKKRRHNYYDKHKSEILEKQKQYRYTHKEKISAYMIKYRQEHKKELSKKQKTKRDEQKEKICLESKIYYAQNKTKIKKNVQNYVKTDRGKNVVAKTNARRKRELGYTLLNKRFVGSEGHHINKQCVIFIPYDIHNGNPHRLNHKKSMEQINTLAIEFMLNGGVHKQLFLEAMFMH